MQKENKTNFHQELKILMDQFLNFIYDLSQNFPKQVQFNLTSQIRRSALSIILNYIEGYARQRKKVLKNFLEISYGSLKETKYLLYFSYKRNFLNQNNYEKGIKIAERIGKMLWGILEKI